MSEVDRLLRLAEELLTARELDAARGAFDLAEEAGASPGTCCGGRWMAAMLDGSFEVAWRESDRLRQCNAPDPHRFWQGEDLHGARVIVRCLHGLGDAVQMLRYAPLLSAVAAEVIFEVPPRLLPLAPFFRGVTEVITWGEAAPRVAPVWEVQAEVMELPYLFRSSLSDLPVCETYLQLPPAQLAPTGAIMSRTSRLRIGLVWAGSDWDPDRSIPLSLLRPVLEQERFEWWNLQGRDRAGDANDGLRDATKRCGDGLLALAATMAHLDLVLTVDTLAAHLAGALGKPTWLMLQHAADWRWMNLRSDSPWYPSMRIFRQSRPGDWESVVQALLDVFAKEFES